MIGLTIGCALACALLVIAETERSPEHRAKPEAPDQRSEGSAESDVRGGRMKYGRLAEWRGMAALRIAAKLVASAAFVAIGTRAFDVGHDPGRPGCVEFARAIFAGLALGAVGDACLLGAGKRWFLAGLVAFLIGHLAYVAGIAWIEPPARWLGDAGWLAVAPAGAGLATLAVLWPRLGALRLPVIAYVATISVMVIAVIAAARGTALPAPNKGRLVAGACVFFLSDLAVARERFVARSFANKLWGLPAYYAGQLLIAWSVAGL